MDQYKVDEAELIAVTKDISKYMTRAASRAEAYANSQFADMPPWDRIVIEMIIDDRKERAELRAKVEELEAVFAPAPEHEQTR